MTRLALALIAAPVVCFGYAYVVYPLLLSLLVARRHRARAVPEPAQWPLVTITVPCYNEEASIAATLEQLLRVDYPAERRQILVISDASTDRTDAIVAGFAARGVELIRLPERRGKSAAENAAGDVARGEIIVNVDATVRLRPESLKALVRAFADPTVGVASGRDISVGDETAEGTKAEAGYVGYEMWVRGLETRLESIVGASGCFYGMRRQVYDTDFPEDLSRDFASALLARERGFRAVSVDQALCVVPRTQSLRSEYRRKLRTMSRGIGTLWYKRQLMNPFRYGWFALMLLSHKLCRWLAYLFLPVALAGLVLLAWEWRPGLVLLGAAALGTGFGIIGLRWPEGRHVPALFAVPAFVLASSIAGIGAWVQYLRRPRHGGVWEPTRRPVQAPARQ